MQLNLANNMNTIAKGQINSKFEFSEDQICKETRIGFEFEFMSELDDSQVVKSLSETLNKKITIPEEITKLNTIAIPNHSEFTPTDKEFKLERDFSGGLNMFELITGPIEYPEAIKVLKGFLNWLKENGYTTSKTSVHINLSFKNPKNLDLKNSILNLNRLKFCLELDEKFVYERFPNREHNVYARTIKTFYPLSDKIDFRNADPINFATPNTKYFGVNFLKQQKNYLEFRYLGGEGYEKKFKSIKECINHFIISLYNVLNNPYLTDKNIKTFRSSIEKITYVAESIHNFERFMFNFPEILILVDLDADFQKVKSFYNGTLYKYILEFIMFGGLEKGIINYDSEYGKIQLKDAKLKNIRKNEFVEFFNCEIDGGLMEKNVFVNCKLNNAIIGHSEFVNCEIKGCKIAKCNSNFLTKYEDCYIENKEIEYNGQFEKCIIRFDKPTTISKVNKCLFIAEDLEKLQKRYKVEEPKKEDIFKKYNRF